MKSAAVWGTGLLLVLAAAYALGRWQRPDHSPTPAPNSDYVGFEPAEIDLGDQLWDTVLPLELTFVNEGSEAVVVGSITSTCDCVLFEAESYEGRSLEPGDALVLPLTLDTGLYPGAKHRTVKLAAASGRQYTAEVFLNVYGTWSLEPDVLDFGEVALGDPDSPDLERTLTFVSETDELVGSPEANVAWLRCFTAQRDTDTTEILVRVAKQELPPGVSTGNIVFKTTSSVRPDTAVYVRVRAVPALVATPPNVFLVGEEVKRVAFADRDGHPTRLVRVEASSEDIRATIVADDQVQFCKAVDGTFAGPVTVRVEDEEGRFTTVVVSGF